MDFQWGDSPPVHLTPQYRSGNTEQTLEQILEQLEFTPRPPIWGNSDTTDANTGQEIEEFEGKLNPVSLTSNVTNVTEVPDPRTINTLVSAIPLQFSTRNSPIETPLWVDTIIYTPQIPEYPQSSMTGVCYIIPVGALDADEVKKPWNSVQYCLSRKHPTSVTTTTLLDDVRCYRTIFSCTGGKGCEFIRDRWHHFEATEDIFNEMAAVRNDLSDPNLQQRAHSFVQACLERFRTYSCTHKRPTCELEVFSSDSEDSTDKSWFIQCVNYQEPNENHFGSLLPTEFNHLKSEVQRIVEGLDLVPAESCGVMDSNRRRVKTCGKKHFGQAGNIIQFKCHVTWVFYTPLDGKSSPIIMASHGMHTHPPIPPTKTPIGVGNQLIKLVNQSQNGMRYLVPLLASPGLQAFCQMYNHQSTKEVHKSLIRMDRIQAIFQKKRALDFPNAISQMSILLAQRDQTTRRYIQYARGNGERFIAICFYEGQVALFRHSEFHSFEITTNHSPRPGAKDVEVIWSWYSPVTERALPLVRVVSNDASPEMYTFMYKKVFEIYQSDFDLELRWKHLHDTGLVGITINQDWKNLIGFGNYLSKFVDPEHHDWTWQVSRCVRFCKSFFQLELESYCTSDRSEGSRYATMLSILDAQSEAEYLKLVNLLEDEPDLYDWALHKGHGVIRSGLNQACSNISAEGWDLFCGHTNTVELLHEIVYKWTKIMDPLRDCICWGSGLDMKYLATDETYEEPGIHAYSDNRSLPIRDADRNDGAHHQRAEGSQDRPWSIPPNPMPDQAYPPGASLQASSDISWGSSQPQSQGVKRTRRGNLSNQPTSRHQTAQQAIDAAMRAKEESRRHPTRMQMNTETPLAPRIELDEEMIELAEAQRNMELEQIDHEFQGDESGRHLARLNVNMRMERSGFPVDPNQGEKDLAGVHRNTETSPMEFSRGQRDAGIRPMQHGVEEDERLLEIRERWLALQRMKFELEEAKFELEKRRLEIEIEKLEIEKERLDVEIKIEEVEKQLDALRRQQV